MTAPWAIVLGAGIIGLSIVAVRLVAPYRYSNGFLVNTVTGELMVCSLEFNPLCRSMGDIKKQALIDKAAKAALPTADEFFGPRK